MPQDKAQFAAEGNVKQQALKVLASLERDIEKRKTELLALETEANQIRVILGRPSRSDGGGRRMGEPRLDWSAALEQLPEVFSSKQVAALTGKPMEQVYAGVSRWSKDKKIKRAADGYHKLPAKRKRK